jgi:phytoene dehydrogenase-like protein
MDQGTYDTVIVGGGIAGLTSAAYLSRSGQRVLLIEKNKECGGLVSSFVRDGFHFDAGVRALEDAGIILPMLKELGIHLEFVKSPVSLGVENEIMHIEGLESLIKYKELLTRLYPGSEEDIARVVKSIRKTMKDMDVLYGIENPVFKDLKHDRAFIFKKLLPWLPKFILTVSKIDRMKIPIENYLSTIIKNPSLKDIISQYFFKNTPAFFAMSYFSLYLDYFYPRGGVGKLSEALKKKIMECGGAIKTETKITEVMAGNRLVKDQNNVAYEYDNLIWAADLKTLYNNLLLNFEQTEKGKILALMDKFTRLNTYEISIPGLKDPELAPSGKTGLIISFLAEYDLFDKIQKAGWYDEFNSEIINRVLNVISGSIYPMLKDKVLARFSFTPVSIENRIGSSEGAITGWSFQNHVPVVNKIQMSDRSVLTPIPSIFQAGQWAYSPAGVPMSILTGKLAAIKVLKRKLKKNRIS